MRVATWNVHEGISEAGIPIDLAATISEYGPDIVALQEFPAGTGTDLGQQLGLRQVAEWNLEPSESAGLLIASKWPLSGVRRYVAATPRRALVRDHPSLRVHRKGALVAQVAAPTGEFTFACVHLLPFHIFDLPDDNAGSNGIWRDLLSRIHSRSHDSTVIAGDFNASEALRTVPTDGEPLSSALGDRQTRNDGRSHDDVLYGNPWRALSSGVAPSLSDHFFCWADLVTYP